MSSVKPPPAEASSSSSSGAGSATSKQPANEAAPAGEFAKRFPRISASFQRYASSRAGRIAATAWGRRRPIAIGLALTYAAVNYLTLRREAYLRDYLHPDTWLVLKVHPGSIVDCRSGPKITALLNSPSAGEDRPSVMELYEVVKALRYAADNDNIRGIFADFSGLHIPSSVAPEPLGLAQLEELMMAIHNFRQAKNEQYYLKQLTPENGLMSLTGKEDEQFPTSEEELAAMASEVKQKLEKAEKELPPPPVSTIAWADSFDSQGSYVLASAFEQVYVQPSGHIPLTGVAMQLPFFKKALDWLGVKVYAEARKEHKSMISSFTQTDGLPPAQLQDEAKLLGELGRSIAHSVGYNRFPDLDPEEAADRVSEMSTRGPFSAQEALQEGLITGIRYKSEVIKELGEEVPPLKSLASFYRLTENGINRIMKDNQILNVAVVHLRGTISNAPGDFSASSAIKGLQEAGADENIMAVVLRIDSGGGDVVASDSIWHAVKRVQEEHKKPVIASFGNASASGGYFASAGADAILACESTITGSIGVASLRPTITKTVFDRFGVSLQTIFTGSKMNSSLHELEPEQKERYSKQIDATYETFLDKVCQGRQISRDVIEELAGGRVWTGLSAWIRCNEEDDIGESKKDDAKIEELPEQGQKEEFLPTNPKHMRIEIVNGKEVKKNDKVTNGIRIWTTSDVTKEGEMSTIRIRGAPLVTATTEQTSAEDEGVEALRRELLADAESSSEAHDEGRIRGQGVIAQSVVEGTGDDSSAEESRLAAAAHRAAEESQQNKNGSNQEAEEKPLGPYGRGLIDGIGGLADAGDLAARMAMEREVEELVKQGMTLEQAAQNVRPQCPRETLPDGSVALATNLRLTRYPKEKNWREMIRDLNRKGDQPTLSLFPRFGNVGLQLRELFTDAAMQVLIKFWRDPALLQRMISEVDRERGMRMEYQTSMRM